MNIQRWKGLIWFGSLLVGGYLAWFVTDFLRARKELSREISREHVAAVLDSVKRPAEPEIDVVDYKDIQRVFSTMDWTGKPPPVVEKTAGPEVQEKPKVAVSSLLKVLAIKVDTVEPAKSLAWVKFVDNRLTRHNEVKEDSILRPEERLFQPFQDVRVEAITPDGVVFAFDDAGREKETLKTVPYAAGSELGVVVVGPGGAIMPKTERRVLERAATQPYNPARTTQIRKNEYQIGTETLRDLDQDYSTILSRDVSYGPYRNPKTGQVEGIKVNRVAPGSLPAQHGLTEGEILKEINGHRVTSVNDAVAFVKANADHTDTWVALFEKQGREYTRTYHSPSR
jgi:hypothetical protein